MNILVTGGAGFIGSHLVDTLIESGHQVVVIDNLSTGFLYNVNPTCIFHSIDITNFSDLQFVFETYSIDAVYHHAAQIHVQKSLTYPNLDATINILGTINVLECMRQYNTSKIIYASSAAVYGTPLYLSIDEAHPTAPESFYGISKLTPEHYIKTYSQLYGFDYTILRYANVYGPRQSSIGEGGVVSIFLDKLIEHQTPTIYGDGLQTRDFIYVKDIAAANLAALHKGSYLTLNIGCNMQTSINELVQLLSKISGTHFNAAYETSKIGDILHSRLSNTQAISSLQWRPQYSLEIGLNETYEYIRNSQVAHPAR